MRTPLDDLLGLRPPREPDPRPTIPPRFCVVCGERRLRADNKTGKCAVCQVLGHTPKADKPPRVYRFTKMTEAQLRRLMDDASAEIRRRREAAA